MTRNLLAVVAVVGALGLAAAAALVLSSRREPAPLQPGPLAGATTAVPSEPASSPVEVSGLVVRGRTAPDCFPGEPCDPPIAAAMLVFSRQGAADIRVPVPGNGTFSTRLPPGLYTVSAAPPPISGGVTPGSVRIPATGAAGLRFLVGIATTP